MNNATAPPPPPPPSTMSPAEQARIRAVAAYVVSSANPSRFQLELTQATKNNLNFDFLKPDHPHNGFYQYTIQVWQSKSSTQKAQAHLQQEKVEQNFIQQQQNNNNSGNNNFTTSSSTTSMNHQHQQQPFFGDNYNTSVFSNNNNNTSYNSADNQTGGIMNFL